MSAKEENPDPQGVEETQEEPQTEQQTEEKVSEEPTPDQAESENKVEGEVENKEESAENVEQVEEKIEEKPAEVVDDEAADDGENKDEDGQEKGALDEQTPEGQGQDGSSGKQDESKQATVNEEPPAESTHENNENQNVENNETPAEISPDETQENEIQQDDNKNTEEIENQKNIEKNNNQPGTEPEETGVITTVEITEKNNQMNEQNDTNEQNGYNEQKEPPPLDKEPSFIQEIKKEAKSVAHQLNPSLAQKSQSKSKGKKIKKGIFISYSPDAGFTERKFVVETVNQLKENNLAEDIWFDKDEGNTDSPCWFSQRMEAVERCRAAVLILSDSYFTCPVSVYEGKALLERQQENINSVKIFLVLYNRLEETEIPRQYNHLLHDMVDLTGAHLKKSLAEKTSVVVGALMLELEQHASINAPPPIVASPDEFVGEYKKKKICQWKTNDLQEWLFNLGIKEFYRQGFAENLIDGFLLMSMTDQDMIGHLSIDSRVVRKKIMQQILLTLDKEHKLADNWHLRARTQRCRGNTVYLVYDPADVRLAQNLKSDLYRKGLQVYHHQKLGQSKEEFLQLNGPSMAMATYILVLLTDNATNSPFVFHEILFADWLGKKLVTAMFRNTWYSLRTSLKAVLGECPAVDFETKLYQESMDVLEHHMKPLRSVPGVVLEQAYLNKMADGLKPLGILATTLGGHNPGEWTRDEAEPKVFISYQWDMQSKVEDIRRLLEANGFPCWADISPTMSQQRGHSSVSVRSTHTHLEITETLQSQIQRNMKAASVVLCCVTPKYMQSDNCIKDLTLAETLHKPIVPVMLRFCPWPPEGAPSQVRKIFVRLPGVHPIDISNEKLFKQNIQVVVERIKKLVTPAK